jgi:hypothetical protein
MDAAWIPYSAVTQTSLVSANFVVMYLLNVILHRKLKKNVVCRCGLCLDQPY